MDITFTLAVLFLAAAILYSSVGHPAHFDGDIPPNARPRGFSLPEGNFS